MDFNGFSVGGTPDNNNQVDPYGQMGQPGMMQGQQGQPVQQGGPWGDNQYWKPADTDASVQQESAWDVPGATSDSWQDEMQTDAPQGGQPLQEPLTGKVGFKPPKWMIIAVPVVVVLIIAMLLMTVANTGVKKKPQTPQQPQVQQSQPAQTNQSGGVPQTSVDGSLLLTRVPDSTTVNYSTDVLTSTGTVTGKLRYLLDNQVVYCIEVSIAVGAAQQKVLFFCNYTTFGSVSKGDLVSVQYQQVQDSFISITSITK